MKTYLLLLLGAGFAGGAGAVRAADHGPALAFLDRVGAVATARMNDFHISPGRGLELTARLDGHGRLSAVRVTRSSGSPETDSAMTHALNRLAVGEPPTDLAGAELTLAVRTPRMVQAKAP